jgi:hypothetical protein
MKWLPSSPRESFNLLLSRSSVDIFSQVIGSQLDLFTSSNFLFIFLSDSGLDLGKISNIVSSLNMLDSEIVGFSVTVDVGVVVPLSGLGLVSSSHIKVGDFFRSELSVENFKRFPKRSYFHFYSLYMKSFFVIKNSLLEYIVDQKVFEAALKG